MNRCKLKKNGFNNLKKDYFKNILVVFIIGIIGCLASGASKPLIYYLNYPFH